MMLASANLRTHGASFLAALLATTFGVALISGTLIVYDSARPAVQPRLDDAAALVLPPRADNEFGNEADFIPWSADQASRIAADLGTVPVAEAVVTDRSFYAQPFVGGTPIEDEGAEEAGHGWSSVRLSPYRLTSGAPPTDVDQIVVPSSLGVVAGESVSVNLAAGLEQFKVSGTLDGPGFYVTDERAAQLDPGVRAIGVVASPDARIDDLETQAEEQVGDRGRVVIGTDRAALEPEFVSHRRNLGTQLIVAMAALGLFTTVFVVGSTLALSVSLRRREIGLLRTVGASPGHIRRMVLGEALAVGLAGGVVGAALGVVAAPAVRILLLDLDVQPPDFRIRISLWPLMISVGVGALVALLGAWSAARSATRVSPMEALLTADVESRPMTRARWILGLVALVGGLGFTVLTRTAGTDSRINTAIAASMFLVVAAAVLSPAVIGPIVNAVTWPFTRRSRSAAPMLIGAALTTGTSRAAATAAPVIAAVGFAVLLSGMVQTMAVTYPAEQTEQLRGLALVTPDGAAGLSDEVVSLTGAGPVGTRASLPTRLFVPQASGRVTVIDAVGSLDERYAVPGEAVLDEATANLLGVQSGQAMSVTFVDGISENIVVSQVLPLDPARGAFVLPRALVREHDPSAVTDSVFVPEDEAPPDLPAGARVTDAYTYALQDYRVDARLTTWLATVLIAMTVGYCGLAVANSTAMSSHRRRSEAAVIKASGGSNRHVLATAVGETSLVVSIGSVLGVMVTALPLLGMAAGLSDLTGTEAGLHVDWFTVTWVVAGCLALASTASAAVTVRVLRVQAG
ncbi:MAG: ABC transporter permease [Rhodococcus sp. (in: high G+C Gram-positive bacteria)]|uniref:ABC transporter permease n=1 Tax=Rhodococcus sp. TaxID=1831 RepID=UPI002AD9ECDB|nr:ABC transporter permease [Rhodococcus sp. (in: high G+C Gram-positive bacteria)]